MARAPWKKSGWRWRAGGAASIKPCPAFTPTASLRRGDRDDRFRALMRFEVERARAYYEEGWPLARLLPPPGRAVFLVMARTYLGLLNAIQSRNYDVFSSRVSLSPWHKAGLVIRALPVRL